MNLSLKPKNRLFGLCASAVLATSIHAHAVVMVMEHGPFGEVDAPVFADEAALNAHHPIAVGDLLETTTWSFTSGGPMFGGDLVTLNDGLAFPTPGIFYAANDSIVDYLFGTPVNVTNVEFFMYADWQRTSAYVDVSTTTDGGANWTLLHQVRQDESNGGSVNREYNAHTLFDDAGDLASGINGIRFQFLGDGMGADESGYSEIDVNGTVVPEPATFSLAVLSLLLLGRRRRR